MDRLKQQNERLPERKKEGNTSILNDIMSENERLKESQKGRLTE